jgi:hypothetical protein
MSFRVSTLTWLELRLKSRMVALNLGPGERVVVIGHQWMKELTHGSAENTKFPPKVDTFQILQNYQSILKYLETKIIPKNLQILSD